MYLTEERVITREQEHFYQALFSDFDNYIEIRLIDKLGKIERFFLTYPELIHYPTPEDKNVYVGIFERRNKRDGTISNCSQSNVIYLDFDGMDLTEVNYRIDSSGLPRPSIIVNSGHGHHVYWLLDKPIGHEIKPILDKLVKVLKADSKSRDIARILRVPDTMNVKDDPIPCKLIQFNNHRTSIHTFENILKVKTHLEVKESTGVIRELADIKINGLHNMAPGVKKGERNFATGRIVQTLRRMNKYTKQEVKDIVFRWNLLNRPVKDAKELKRDIDVFWYEYNDKDRLRYDGKDFSDERLQELNKRFIDSKTTFFKGVETDSHNYDNELLHPKKFKDISGLTFAILSIINLSEDDGIRREHIADLCHRNKTDKNLTYSLKILQKMNYIIIKKKKRTNYYIFTEKANYNRGYTAVSKSLHRSFLNGELKEHEYKLMILLESYAYDNKKEIFPGNPELAYRSGQDPRTIQRNLKKLQHKQFIKIEIKHGKRYIRFIYR